MSKKLAAILKETKIALKSNMYVFRAAKTKRQRSIEIAIERRYLSAMILSVLMIADVEHGLRGHLFRFTELCSMSQSVSDAVGVLTLCLALFSWSLRDRW